MQNSEIVFNSLYIDQVYDKLLDAISFGDLKPGERVRQSKLAERLGVSRQPISHALQLLKHQGLVRDAGKQGVQVAPLDGAYINQLYMVRSVLEDKAARMAVGRVHGGGARQQEVDTLNDALLAGQKALRANAVRPELVRADYQFHLALYRLSGNPVIEQVMTGLWPHIMRSMLAVLEYGDQDAAAVAWDEHAKITAHIITGNADLAAAACSMHLQRASGDLCRKLEQLNRLPEGAVDVSGAGQA